MFLFLQIFNFLTRFFVIVHVAEMAYLKVSSDDFAATKSERRPGLENTAQI